MDSPPSFGQAEMKGDFENVGCFHIFVIVHSDNSSVFPVFLRDG